MILTAARAGASAVFAEQSCAVRPPNVGDSWSSGGNSGLVCLRVPKHLLLAGECQLFVARRRGKLRREGNAKSAHYHQFNVSTEENPGPLSGSVTIWHILPTPPLEPLAGPKSAIETAAQQAQRADPQHGNGGAAC